MKRKKKKTNRMLRMNKEVGKEVTEKQREM